MGCDIHIYTEAKINGKWTCVDRLRRTQEDWDNTSVPYTPIREVYEGRNYILFGALAGVRQWSSENSLLISEPKGLPNNLSDVIQEIADFQLEHTPSWLTLKELKDYKWYNKQKVYRIYLRYFFARNVKDSAVNKLSKLQKKHKVQPEDIRIVFWFDS